MAEEKKKATKKRETTSKITLDKNELSEIITNALLEYDKKKEEQEEQDYYSEEKNKGVGFKMFFKMLCKPKKYVNTQNANTLIVKNIINSIYKFFEYLLYIVSGLFFISAISWLFGSLIQTTQWWVYVICLGISITALLAARVVRIMALDVERTKDSNFLITLLALIISIASIIIAIVV